MSEKKTALIISGMHRSGTSSIAGVVGMLGAILPQYLLPPQSDNPRGFFESDKVMRFNDKILSESGSSWSDWRTLNNEWQNNPNFNTYVSEASLILSEEFGSSTFIVLKDPRFAKILPFWNCVLEKLEFRSCHIIPIRDPAEVAASLYERNTLSKNLSKMVWLRHVLDAEIYSRGLPRVFVFWADFLQDWEREVVKIAISFNFSWPRLTDHVRSDVDEFLSLELRHHHEVSNFCADNAIGNGNEYVKRAYVALNVFKKDPYSLRAIEVFDAIRQDYLKTERIYGPVFADMDASDKRQKVEFDQTKVRAAELAERVGELELLLNATVSERDAARHQSNDLSATSVGKDDTINALSRELDQTRAQAAELAVRVGELESLLNATVHERDAARVQAAELAVRVGELESLLNATVHERDVARHQSHDLSAVSVGKDDTINALSRELDQTRAQAAELAVRVGELESLLNSTVHERDAARHQNSVLGENVADLQTRVSTALERSQVAESELEKLRNLSAVGKIAEILRGWAILPAKGRSGK